DSTDVHIEGDPNYVALRMRAGKAGLERGEEAARSPRTDSIPFESEHRFTASLHHAADGSAAIHVVGAPERILEMCQFQRGEQGDQPVDPDYWRRMFTDTAANGQIGRAHV